MILKKYTKPTIHKIEVFMEDGIASGSARLEPGESSGIPDIVDEIGQNNEQDWVFDDEE